MKIHRFLLMFMLLIQTSVYAASIDAPLKVQKQSDTSSVKSQKKIDKLSDKTLSASDQYQSDTQRADALKIYNQQLKKLVESQENEKASITKQVGEIDNIETNVLPLMLKMTSTLNQVISTDVPFLIKERKQRVADLEKLLNRADVSVGEKFRRIMEAYSTEMDYGNTIETYQGQLNIDGKPLTVNLLRIGRIGFYYQTLDGEKSGRWNVSKKKWEPLDSNYRRAILDGIRIAKKQAPPKMLTLAVQVPGEAK